MKKEKDKCKTCSHGSWYDKLDMGTCSTTNSIIGIDDKRFNANYNNTCTHYKGVWWLRVYYRIMEPALNSIKFIRG
jgi:hypothetical protein